MKILEIDKRNGAACFLHWNWKKFRFERTCWAKDIPTLFGRNRDKNHLCIMTYK